MAIRSVWQLEQKQSLPLEVKVVMAEQRIRMFYEHFDGDVYVAMSGGKDSTVVAHLVRGIYPDVPLVFSNTGVEFPEIVRFVKSLDAEIVRPKRRFAEVVERFGWPIISKEQSEFIYDIREGRSEKLRQSRLEGNRFGQGKIKDKWRYLLDAPFKISSHCCDCLKKAPLSAYEKASGRHCIDGVMACESTRRKTDWLKYGCNAFNHKRPVSHPIAVWTDEDVWAYIRSRGLQYAEIYDKGWERTGCIFCGYGVHLEGHPNRFERLAITHPKLYDYYMNKLGGRAVWKYVGIDV